MQFLALTFNPSSHTSTYSKHTTRTRAHMHAPRWVFHCSPVVQPNTEASCSGMTLFSLTLPSGYKLWRCLNGGMLFKLSHSITTSSPQSLSPHSCRFLAFSLLWCDVTVACSHSLSISHNLRSILISKVQTDYSRSLLI